MGKTSKRFTQALEKSIPQKLHIPQAVEAVKDFPATKFDATVDLVMHLGIDPRQADQALRGSFTLPHGIGKTKKVIAFCEGADADAATEAGAIEVGGDELAKKIQGGWMDFDVAIASPSMMRVVGKLGRVLGPVGKMPSPKAGTVTPKVADAVKEFAAGKVNYRNDDGGNLHLPVGKVSFENAMLVENIETFVNFIRKSKPASVKGAFIKKVSITATMSPGIEVDIT